MKATRFWALVCLGAIGSAASLSCGSDEATSPSHPGGGGEAGEAGASSYPVAGNAGNAAAENGGSSGADQHGGDGAGAAGAGGVKSPPGGGGEGGELGFAGSGGAPVHVGEKLELCARLSGLIVHADNVGRVYSNAAYDDCRIKWVIPKGAPLYEFRNALVTWSLELWGCQGLPVDTFALVAATPPLSSGDATLLIDHYMTAAQDELDLSPAEFDEMQAAIQRLAAPLISSNSTEPSNTQCVEAGGAGGAGGQSGTAGIAGDSGVGGAP